MNGKISVVINTYNEEGMIERAIKSVTEIVDEVLVCDMNSQDDSALIAKKLGAKVIFHKHLEYVEPARNFAVSKASNDWILVIDPDEEIPESLVKKLQEVAKNPGITTFVEIPRKNLIFGKWMKGAMWWPDYNIRFFKKDSVVWGEKIHRPPKTEGQGIKLPAEERFAIIHYHYSSISQFLSRLDRYTSVQAKELVKAGYEFNFKDLFSKPLGEFLGRYFANKGFEDGLHGLTLSLLQALSHLIMYLKVWEMQGFGQQDIKLPELEEEVKLRGGEIRYWFRYSNLSDNLFKRLFQKAKGKL